MSVSHHLWLAGKQATPCEDVSHYKLFIAQDALHFDGNLRVLSGVRTTNRCSKVPMNIGKV